MTADTILMYPIAKQKDYAFHRLKEFLTWHVSAGQERLVVPTEKG